jgi:hypothetical protein
MVAKHYCLRQNVKFGRKISLPYGRISFLHEFPGGKIGLETLLPPAKCYLGTIFEVQKSLDKKV